MHWLDQKYAGLISSKLERFTIKKTHPYLANFRCPLCGDSKRNKRKARGYFYSEDQHIKFKCQNCGAALHFGTFLKQIEPSLYSQYALEKMKDKAMSNPHPAPTPDISITPKPRFIADTALAKLKKISQLSPEHPVKKYIVRRKIPNVWHSRLFLVDNFKEWTNTIIPDKFPNIENDEPRLVIPFISRDRKWIGYSGRSFKKDAKVRYITIMIDQTHEKVFNLDQIDFTKKVYVTEGQIDAMHLPNAIAMGGADIDIEKVSKHLTYDNAVFIYDNEPRNKEIVARIGRILDRGGSVVLWPETIEEKDINEMVCNGMSERQVEAIINSNTYSGLKGKLAFSQWKKI